MPNKLFFIFKKSILSYFIIFLFIIKIEPCVIISNGNQFIDKFGQKKLVESSFKGFSSVNNNDSKTFDLSNKSCILAVGAIAGESIAAFTLAEVLITLTVIGVVASMAIPALQNSTNDMALKTTYRKKFAEFSQAFQLIQSDSIDLTTVNLTTLSNYLKLRYIGPIHVKQGGEYLFHQANEWFSRDGTPRGSPNTGYQGAMMQDGTLLYLTVYTPGGGLLYPEIIIDVNGHKPPNTVGKDIFGLYADTNGTHPACGGSFSVHWVANTTDAMVFLNQANAQSDCDTGYGWGCSALYLKQ